MVGDKGALLTPERVKLFVPIPGVRTAPGGNCGFKPEEELITLSRVLFKGPWILEPVNPELELPETKLGRTGRTELVLAGTKPASPERPLGACPRVGATIPSMEMRVRMSAPVRLQVICMIFSSGQLDTREHSLRIF